ncbi:hypothetical protein H9P43_007548 [Blastocladiella emersonii ATCC 22665]|nr:hypothetical protein H9P43_007548 [Blastocladiella emersonii ATCC 22665]
MLTVHTAVAVIPPPALWPRLQPFRRVLDPGHSRWPPHINLLFPFLTPRELPAALPDLAAALATTQPFDVALRDVTTFIAKRAAYIVAQPETPNAGTEFAQLHASLAGAFPACDGTAKHESGYQAHLTVARAAWNPGQPGQTAPEVAEIEAAARAAMQDTDPDVPSLAWTVQGVYVLRRRDDDPFSFAHYVPFGGVAGNEDPHGLVGTMYDPDASTPHVETLPLLHHAASPSSPATTPETIDHWPAWREYTAVATPTELKSDAYDETWVTLPCYAFHPQKDAWAPLVRPGEEIPPGLAPPGDPPATLRVVTYNVLNDWRLQAAARHVRLLDQLRDRVPDADVVALQEVTPLFLAMLLEAPWLRSAETPWFVSHGSVEWARALFPKMGAAVVLSRYPFHHLHLRLTHQKQVLVAQFPDLLASLAVVHLTSSHSSNAEPMDKRVAQVDPIGQFLARHRPAVPNTGLTMVAGDWNTDDPDEDALLIARHGWVDAAHVLGGPVLGTFDPLTNPLAHACAMDQTVSHAYDRIVYAPGGAWAPAAIRLIGHPDDEAASVAHLASDDERLAAGYPASDHYGVEVTFRRAEVDGDVDMSDAAAAEITDEDVRARLEALGDYETPDGDACRTRALALVARHLNRLHKYAPLPVPDLVAVGSFGLNLHSRDSDVDALCFISTAPAAFADAVERTPCPSGLRLVRSVRDSVVPVVQFVAWDRVSVDVQYVAPGNVFLARAGDWIRDPLRADFPTLRKSVATALLPLRDGAAMAKVLSDPARLVYRVLRRWACDRGIYDGRTGYLGGASLLVLVLRVAHANPGARSAVDLVRAWFMTYARHPWSVVAVTLGGAPTAPLRAPMAVYSVHAPKINIARHVTPATCAVIARAIREAAARVVGMDDAEVVEYLTADGAGFAEFVKRYPSFVRVSFQRSGAEQAAGWRRAVGTFRWAQALRSVSGDVQLWPIPLQTRTEAQLSDTQLTAAHDAEATYLVGIAGDVDARAVEEHLRGFLPPPDAVPWCGYVTTVPRDQVRHEDLVPAGHRDWGDDATIAPGANAAADANTVMAEQQRRGGRGRSNTAQADDVQDEAMDTDEAPAPAAAPAHAVPAPRPHSGPKPSTGPLRPAQDVMNRLLWDDTTYDPADYVVGYVDRFDGIKERALLAFRPDDEDHPDWVPLHRIVHFRRVSDGVTVWDRHARVDLVFRK